MSSTIEVAKIMRSPDHHGNLEKATLQFSSDKGRRVSCDCLRLSFTHSRGLLKINLFGYKHSKLPN